MTLNGAVLAFVDAPTDPDAATQAFREIWRERGERIGAIYDVPACPYTADELRALDAAGRRVGYLPPEMATQATRHLLAKIFPLLQSYALFERNPVTNRDNPSGWFDYDSPEEAPYLNTDAPSLIEAVTSEGRWLASLNQYVVASQDSKLLTGRYLDEGRTWSRLAQYLDGKLVCSRIDGPAAPGGERVEVPVDGSLLVAFDLGDADRVGLLGGRSVGAPTGGRGLIDDGIDPATLSPETIDDIADPATLDLDEEWQRQVATYVRLGFHTELGMTEAEYVASLPRIAPQPPQYAGRLDVPLVVDPRISWEQQADLADISRSFSSRSHSYTPIDDRHVVPAQPYVAWVNWFGQRFPQPISPGEARAGLADDELGANVHEMVALHIAHPALNFTGRFIDAIGFESRTMELHEGDATTRNPGLCFWRGRAEIGANMHPVAYSIFRPLIRGTSITTTLP